MWIPLKNKLTILLSLIFISISPISTMYAKNTPLTEEKLSDTNKTIFVKSNQPSFTIALDANPSTGYQWLYDPEHSSDNFIESAINSETPSKTKLIGEPGLQYFKFTLKPTAFQVPTLLKITLIYARHWEMGASDQVLELKIITDK